MDYFLNYFLTDINPLNILHHMTAFITATTIKCAKSSAGFTDTHSIVIGLSHILAAQQNLHFHLLFFL